VVIVTGTSEESASRMYGSTYKIWTLDQHFNETSEMICLFSVMPPLHKVSLPFQRLERGESNSFPWEGL
jgi:hypothetical protein